jgi:hypothetical protein
MINLLLGFWQFFWVWGFGFFLAKRLKGKLPYGYYAAISFALGETCLTYAYFALGMVGGLRLSVLLPLAIILTALSLISWNREGVALYQKIVEHLSKSPGSAVVAAIILIIYFLAACVPEREVDSLWYHLAVPLHYITHGGYIQLVPFNMPSHYPMNAHLHYCFSLLVGNDTTAKIFNYCHFFPLLIIIGAVTKRYASAKWSLFAVALYLCCLHFRLPMMVNVQRAVYFYVFLSYALLWYSLERGRWNMTLLAAVFCGMSMGTKFNGLLFGFAPQLLFMTLRTILWKRKAWKEETLRLCIYALIALALMSPWMIKSYVLTGNPLYPMLEEIFPTDPHFIPAMKSNANNHGINLFKSKTTAEFFGQIGVNLRWLIYNAYLLFFLGLFSLFILLIIRKKRWVYPITAALLAYGFFPLLWGSDIARLFGVNNGLVVLCITLVVSWLTPRINRGHWLVGIILFSLFFTFIKERYYFLSSPNIRWYGATALSETARREWILERRIFSDALYRMKQWLNVNADPTEELYGYRTGYLFYLDRKYIVSGAHFKEQIDIWLHQDADYTAQQLHQLDVKLLLTNHDNWIHQDENIKKNWQDFVQRYLDPVRHEGEIHLYRLLTSDEAMPLDANSTNIHQ